MNLCECTRIMDRINQALSQLINSMIGANNSNTQSLTDSGETLSNTPSSNNNQSQSLELGMMFVTIAFLVIFSLFIRAIQRNNNTENNNNNEPNKLFISIKI